LPSNAISDEKVDRNEPQTGRCAKPTRLSRAAQTVYDHLVNHGQSATTVLVRACNIDASSLAQALLELELHSLVEFAKGMYWPTVP
jgi:predicted Rossmann fold nucleotide-binding protein DprA/Smf involved in DNA uptake